MSTDTHPSLEELARTLRDLEGKSYKEYKQIRGEYAADGFVLAVDHVQGDPFADASRCRAVLPEETARLPAWALRTPDRRRACADFLNRRLYESLAAASSDAGSGKSGQLEVLRPSQEVLTRSSLGVRADGTVEARFRVGLPARGRRILGAAAADLVTERVPGAVLAALRAEALDLEALRLHVETVEDACALRAQLREHRLVAFVADGAALPRRSGVDDRPLGPAAVPFRSPESLRVTLSAPNAGAVTGLGIRSGVTLVVGGGYHGKSTLLRAIERGVYDHLPGDGRERVVAVRDAVKIRAEDGRRVAGTDISNFIGRLPGGQDTRRFSTENASGSTSQAAAIAEALELGCRCLLLDEDTSATNFMIRDARMQALIADEHEPITPFIDRARQLADERGVSTVLVVGGSGDYFDVADTVIAMRDYLPAEVTAEARRVARERPTERRNEGGPWHPVAARVPLPRSIDPSRGHRDVRITTRAQDRVLFGTVEVDLGAVEQIVELAQTRAMAQALAWAREGAIDGRRTVRDALEAAMARMEEEGLDVIHPHLLGEHAAFRIFELGAFLNRLRSLEVRALDPSPSAAGPAQAAG